MTTVSSTIAATPDTLAKVVAAAKPGDTIMRSLLLVLLIALFPPPASAAVLILTRVTDRIIQGGTYEGALIVASKNIRLIGVTFACGPLSAANAQCVRVVQSSGIAFEAGSISARPAVTGVAFDAKWPDATGNVIGLPSGKCLNIDTSDHVTVRGVDVSGCHRGVVFYKASALLVTGNTIHDLRTVPIDGACLFDCVFTRNVTRDSTPWRYGAKDGGSDGDHGDFLHLWALPGMPPVTGLIIEGNQFLQGAHGRPMMGIYLDDNRLGIGFAGAVIRGNIVATSDGQGVRLEMVSGVLAGNVLTWTAEGVEHNKRPRFVITGGSHDMLVQGNVGKVDLYKLTAAELATIKVVK